MMEVTRRYGHTVYTICAFGSPESACTYEDRLQNLIQHEADKMLLHAWNFAPTWREVCKPSKIKASNFVPTWHTSFRKEK